MNEKILELIILLNIAISVTIFVPNSVLESI